MNETHVEIAIAACNEETTIAATIRAFRCQTDVGVPRILVCANGCTDNTVAIVRELQQDDPNLVLDVTLERGKPNAWNRLREMASRQYLCFADGDVTLPAETLSRMVSCLQTHAGRVAAGARLVPSLAGASWRQRVAAPPAGPIHGLCGRLYLCNRALLAQRLGDRGFSAMPKSVIHEDRWITYIIGRGNWMEAPGAVVFYVPPTWRDLLPLYRRHVRGMRQLRREWIDLHTEEAPRTREYYSWRAEGFLDQTMSHLSYPEKVLGYAVRRIASMAARIQVAFEEPRNGLAGWETAYSTKQIPDVEI